MLIRNLNLIYIRSRTRRVAPYAAKYPTQSIGFFCRALRWLVFHVVRRPARGQYRRHLGPVDGVQESELAAVDADLRGIPMLAFGADARPTGPSSVGQ